MPRWEIPEGVRVEPDGTWRVGALPMVHSASLRWLKQHLVFDAAGAGLVEGGRRLPVEVAGPAYVVLELRLDPLHGTAAVRLDDDSEEAVQEDALGMDETSGRFECAVRGGRARALFSRGAHQCLIEHAEQEGGRFFLRVGLRRLSIRV